MTTTRPTSWTLTGESTQFCDRPDGSVVSAHEFAVDPATAHRHFGFEYATARCVCGRTLRASRQAPAEPVECRNCREVLRPIEPGHVYGRGWFGKDGDLVCERTGTRHVPDVPLH